MIIANNILLLIAVGICMINKAGVILIGRFFYGMCAGTFTVMCPKFISEVAPTEYKGPFGAMSQFMCVFGILAVTLMGLHVPNCITQQNVEKFPDINVNGTNLVGSFLNLTNNLCTSPPNEFPSNVCLDPNGPLVQNYWRVVWGIPALLGVI